MSDVKAKFELLKPYADEKLYERCIECGKEKSVLIALVSSMDCIASGQFDVDLDLQMGDCEDFTQENIARFLAVTNDGGKILKDKVNDSLAFTIKLYEEYLRVKDDPEFKAAVAEYNERYQS